MQSAINAGNENDTNLVTAEALREMTISKEALLENQKRGVLESLMSSMVRIATEQGGKGYIANFGSQFDPTLLADITKELTDLGYVTKTEAKTDEKLGTVVSLTINW